MDSWCLLEILQPAHATASSSRSTKTVSECETTVCIVRRMTCLGARWGRKHGKRRTANARLSCFFFVKCLFEKRIRTRFWSLLELAHLPEAQKTVLFSGPHPGPHCRRLVGPTMSSFRLTKLQTVLNQECTYCLSAWNRAHPAGQRS